MRSGLLSKACGLVLLLGCPATATAQPPQVTVSVTACPDVDGERVAAIAALELSAHAVPADDPGLGITRVVVHCTAARAALEVEDPVSGKLLSRSIDLGAVAPEARSRVLALAIAELVGSSWYEIELHPSPVVVPEEATAPAAERDEARRALRRKPSPERFALLATGGTRLFTNGPAPLFGGGVELEGGFELDGSAEPKGGWPQARWRADLLVEASETSLGAPAGTQLGTLLVSGSLGYQLAWTPGRWIVAGTVGGRLGWGRLTGRPPPNSSFDSARHGGAWGGPLVRMAARHRLASGMSWGASLEGGWAAAGLAGRVQDQRVAEISGGWLGLAVAWGVSL